MNSDLEKEYSKYGINLSELDRIIAEYTGSTALESLDTNKDENGAKTETEGTAADKSAKSETEGTAADKSVKSEAEGTAADKSVKSETEGAVFDKSEKLETDGNDTSSGSEIVEKNLTEGLSYEESQDEIIKAKKEPFVSISEKVEAAESILAEKEPAEKVPDEAISSTMAVFGSETHKLKMEESIEDLEAEENAIEHQIEEPQKREYFKVEEPVINSEEKEKESRIKTENTSDANKLSMKKSDRESILQRRLSEAKVDSMFGLEDDEEYYDDSDSEEIEAGRIAESAVHFDESEAERAEADFGKKEEERAEADFGEKEEERAEADFSKKEEERAEADFGEIEEEAEAESAKKPGLSLSDSSEGSSSGAKKTPRVDRAKLLMARLESNRDKDLDKTDDDIEGDSSSESTEKDSNKAPAQVPIKEMSWMGRNWCWLLAMGITGFFMLVFMIFANVAPFGKNSFTLVDSMHQYVPFFSIYQEKLKSFGNLSYTWSVGGGVNFQSLLLYYMASPLNLLVVFVSRSGIYAFISVLIALKISLSAGAFSYFLSRRKGKISCNMIITGLGVAYALNNYMAGYYWNVMWFDCIMVLPLIMLGFERLMREKDFRLYVLALFYSLFCNYYISFMICFFLILWFFAYGHKPKTEEEGFKAHTKKFFADGLRFAGASLLAAAMACFSLLIAYLAITKTSSARLAFPPAETYGSFFDVFKAMFMLTRPITHMTYDGGVNIYCGVFAIVLFFLYLVSDKIELSEKIRKLLLLAFLFISFNHKFYNYIWHGFHDQYGIPNRFSFLFIFTLLLVGYEAIIRVKKLSPVQIIIAGILSLSLLFITYYKVDMATDISAKVILLVSHGLIVVYSIVLFIRNKFHNLYKTTTVIIGILMFMEILINAAIGMGKNDVADGKYHIQYADSTQAAMNKARERAKDQNIRFFREDLTDYIMLDENSYNNMNCLGTFCSTVRGDMVSAMGALGYYTGANEYLYMGSTPMTDDILGVRYIYSRGERFYPEGDRLPLIYDEGGVRVYENEDALPIAYQVYDDIMEWDLNGPRVADSLNRFAWLSSGNTDVFEKAEPEITVSGINCTVGLNNDSSEYISYEVTNKDQVVVNIEMSIEESGRYFMNLRGNYIDKVAYSLNGEEKSRDRNYIQMFDMGELSVGDNVSIDIMLSKGCPTEGNLNFFLHTLNEDSLDMLITSLSEKPFEVEEFKDGYVKGKIDLSKGKMVMTTIPYDEGWTVYDNGQKAETVKVGGAFLGIITGSGEHELEFKFTPDGFVIGLIVSVLGWIIFFILYIVRSRLTDSSKEVIIRR